jgi:hypothetical protein
MLPLIMIIELGYLTDFEKAQRIRIYQIGLKRYKSKGEKINWLDICCIDTYIAMN